MKTMLAALLLTLSLSGAAAAESRYVTDQISVALRAEQNDTAPPLERLVTGAKVELLEDLGPFVKIRSSTGTVGYARARYFVATPPGTGGASEGLRARLDEEQKRSRELAAEIARLKEAGAAGTPAAATALQQELDDLKARYRQLQQNTDDLPGILREQERLKAEATRLAAENETLRAKAAGGGSGSALQWFFAGGAVFFAGWLAGKASRQKRRYL